MAELPFEQLLQSLLELDEPAREARLQTVFADDPERLAMARQRLQAMLEVTLPAITLDGASVVRVDVARLQTLFARAMQLDAEQRAQLLAQIEAEDADLHDALRRMLLTDQVLRERDSERSATSQQGSTDGNPDGVALERLQALFDRLIGLDQAGREALLERECAQDQRLRAQLEALLASDQALARLTARRPRLDVAALLRSLALSGPSDRLARASAGTLGRFEAPGDQIGPWQLVRPLGRGGMGTVWLAQRADGHFQRVVALKLISAGQESEAIESRFLRERQILASLNHPNIAKLLDGGMAPDGRPYFVLEYVDGLPITQHCDQRRLSVVDRLRLFLQVCRAVAHAHQRLVVHRDLKPSNILVTGERMVQLLDFGIAKLLHPDLRGLTELTRPEDQAMTPRYAAPEQIRNETITTATDIYALGVLLYELLTGELPYGMPDQAGHALERAILEQEPRRPCATLSDPANLRAAAHASERGVDRGELSRQLQGDLETVVLKALKKQPAERYPSVEALAKDLEAYLDGKPVSAQPDSWRYRLGKFVGRHRTAVALGSLAVVGLIGVSLFSLQQASVAHQQANRAEAVGAFLVGLFEDIDPARGDAVGLRARDLLDNGARRVDQELAYDPLLQARMNAVLGRLQLATGDAASALPRLALAYRQTGMGDPERLRAGLDQLRALTALQRFDEAAQLGEQLGELAVEDQGRAIWLEARADLAAEAGRLDEAQHLAESALALWTALPGEHRDDRARCHGVLAKVADLGDQLDVAEVHAREALMLIEGNHGRRHIAVALALERLANLLRRRSELPAARQTLAEAIELAQALLGSDHASTLSMRRLDADLLEEAGQLEQAAAALETVLSDAERRYGRFHLSRALALNSLAAIDFRERKLAAAAERMREVVAIYRVLYGDGHNEVATVLNNLANVQRERGLLDEASTLMNEVLAIRRATVGEDGVDYAYSLLGVARIAQLRGADAESEAHFTRAGEIFAAALGQSHPLVYSTRLRVAHAQLDQGNRSASTQGLAALGEPPDPATATSYRWLQLRLHAADQDPDERAAAYQSLLEQAAEVWTERDPRRIAITLEAAQAYRLAGNMERAAALRQSAGIDEVSVLEPRIRALLAH